MRYDLNLVVQLCDQLGLSGTRKNDRVEIALGQGAVLCFQNAQRDEDCLVGFEDTPWHTHDDFMFADGQGNFVELNYLDIVSGLKDGRILVCERRQDGVTMDRWLVHRDANDFNAEFTYMSEGEELKVIRPRLGVT